MQYLELLQEHTWILVTSSLVFGLLVGSFLNVVILRLPRMLEQEWSRQCQEYLQKEPLPAEAEFNLVRPASHCPACGHKIRAWENIPVLSYLWLRGRCSQCHAPISMRYPIVELFTGLMTAVIAWQLGPHLHTLAAMLLTWSLISLSFIDYDHKLLPDMITLPLLWLGLLINLNDVFADSRSSLLGAAFGYLVLWSIFKLHHAITGREGMGYGDFKLLAMLGAWMGWQSLLPIILLSSLAGAVIGITLILVLGRDRQLPIPFGPYLAIAGWITFLWGDDLRALYFGLSGLG